MKIFLHLLTSMVAIIVSAYLIPGVYVNLQGSLVLAIVLGVINTFIKPVIKVIAFPITLVTLGLFSLVINAFFIILSDKIVSGFSVSGFFTALIFSIVLTLVNAFFGKFTEEDKKGLS